MIGKNYSSFVSDYSLMKSKKEIILETALDLFAKKGYSATSTSKIAKQAGVSEGLIFRHFSNKEGLLNAIMEMGKEKGQALFNLIQNFETAKDQLKYILQIPFQIPVEEHSFWKLLYALKWQADSYDEEISSQLTLELIEIFKKLGYENCELEASYVMLLFDGMATSVLLKSHKDQKEIQQLILKKYNL